MCSVSARPMGLLTRTGPIVHPGRYGSADAMTRGVRRTGPPTSGGGDLSCRSFSPGAIHDALALGEPMRVRWTKIAATLELVNQMGDINWNSIRMSFCFR